MLHAAAGVVKEYPLGTADWWAGNIYDAAVRWCVPVFVMISGALLLDPHKAETLQTFYRKRVGKIFIPLVFWTAVYVAWNARGMLLGHDPLNLPALAKMVLSGKPHYHMWFLYMLIGLYLFTPFLRQAVAHSGRAELAFFTAVAFVIAALHAVAAQAFDSGPTLFLTWFLSYLPYFLAGYLIRTCTRQFAKPVLAAVFLLSAALTALGCYQLATLRTLDDGLYFYGYLSFTVIPMSLSVMYLLKHWQTPLFSAAISQRLSALTLGVYLVHPLMLALLDNVGYGALDFNPIASVPVATLVASLLSLAAAWMLARIPYLRRTI